MSYPVHTYIISLVERNPVLRIKFWTTKRRLNTKNIRKRTGRDFDYRFSGTAISPVLRHLANQTLPLGPPEIAQYGNKQIIVDVSA